MKTTMLSNGIFILINVSCNISYVTLRYTNFKKTCFCSLREIVSCRYNITVDRILVIDCNSISSQCIGLKHLYSSVSTTFYFVKGHI